MCTSMINNTDDLCKKDASVKYIEGLYDFYSFFTQGSFISRRKRC